MSIKTKLSDDGSKLCIQVEGRFDFSAHQDFRRAYEECEKDYNGYIVDLCDTNYLDSSALGMLLLLRDYAGGDQADIAIVNSQPAVKEILETSCFDSLFKMPD